MHRVRFVIIAAFALFYFSSTWPAEENRQILKIRKLYQDTQKNLKNYRQISQTIEKEDPQSGMPYSETVTFFYNEKTLALIEVDVVGDLAGDVTELYFHKGQVYFIYEYSWHGASREHSMGQNRYYFDEGKMIRWIGSDSKQVPPGNPEYLLKEKEKLKLAEEYFRLAK